MDQHKKIQTVAKIIKEQEGKAVTVTFIKRTNNEKRVMNCRLGVKKHLKGGTLKYNPKDYDLLTCYDLQKKDYRCISLDAVLEVVAAGVTYSFAE
jgi:hypothetical protein